MRKAILRVYSSPPLVRALNFISRAMLWIFVPAYLFALYSFLKVGITEAFIFALKTGVPFVMVSVARRAVDAPRPYELYGFPNPPPREKTGSSFPSRHVFSAALISAIYFEVFIPIAVILIFFTLLLSATRVLLALHFVRDVLFGAALGFIFGVLDILIF